MKGLFTCFFTLLTICNLQAATITYYTRASNTWSTPGTWAGVCGGTVMATAPTANDDVIIVCNGTGRTVTVNGNFTCRNLTLGAGSGNAVVNVNPGCSITITGTLTIGTGAGGTCRLNAQTGTVNVNGALKFATTGTNNLRATTGTINISPAVMLSSTTQSIQLTGAGIINFYSHVTDQVSGIITANSSTVNFYKNYTVNTTAAVWAGNVNTSAAFYGNSCTITPTTNITFRSLFIAPGANVYIPASTGTITVTHNLTITSGTLTVNDAATISQNMTLNSSAGVNINADLTIAQIVTINSSSVVNLNGTNNLTVGRDWINTGGTLSGAAGSHVYLIGTPYTIQGPAQTNFPNFHIGNGTTQARYTINANTTITCTSFTLETSAAAAVQSLSHAASTSVMQVNGNVTIKQLSANSTNSWNINTGRAVVTGSLTFSPTGTFANSNTPSRITQVVVTSGRFDLSNAVNWMTATTNTIVVTEVISVTTGTLSFGTSLSMPQGSGTLRVTGTGTIEFNGATTPSLNFNANGTGTKNAVFTNVSGSNLIFNKGFTNNNVGYAFTAGSNAIFTGTAVVTPVGTATISFGNVIVNSGANMILAGNIGITNDWTNNNGTLTSYTNTVIFSGAAASTQVITGEDNFYNVTAGTATAIIKLNSSATIINQLNMNGHNLNLNTYTLTLGTTNPGATLSRTAGIAYGGWFRRWWPSGTVISSTTGSLYGLFPMGTSTNYRPVGVNSTATAASSGYVSAYHIDSLTVTNVSYNDAGTIVSRVSDQYSSLAVSNLTGGTYIIDVAYANFESPGTASLADYRLVVATPTVGVISAVGTYSLATGTTAAPILKRGGLTSTQLNNTFLAGTSSIVNTPIRSIYYSIKSGNWTDNSVSGPWSYSVAGVPCNCAPTNSGYVVINSHTLTVNATSTVGFVDIRNGGTLIGTFTLTVGYDLFTAESGKIAPTGGRWAIGRDLRLNGTGASSKSGTGRMTIAGDFVSGQGTSLAMTSPLQVAGEVTINGTIDLATQTFSVTGTGISISGTGTITATTGKIAVTNGNKIIATGTKLSVPNVSISSGLVVTNNGIVSIAGDLTGSNASSNWINEAGSRLNITGALLATGTLTASAIPDTVNYNGSGPQTINATSYHTLICSNAGTKTMAASFSVDDALILNDAVVMTEAANTLSGNADLIMTDNSELILTRASDANLPPLLGNYSLPGGTVRIVQTGGTATLLAEDYYNLSFSGTRPHDISAITTINNNLNVGNSSTIINNAELTVQGILTYSTSGSSILTNNITLGGFTQSNGILNDGGYTIEVNDSDWTRTGGTFTTSGEVIFNGTENQQITSLATITTQNFNNITISKPVGTSTLSLAGSFDRMVINGNWVNNGGTFDGGARTLVFSGTSNTIGGTVGTDFPNIKIEADANYTLEGANNYTASSLTFTVSGAATSLTYGTGNPALDISGNVILFQPGINGVTTAWNINSGSSVVSGNLTFNGNNNNNRIRTITITDGNLDINGTCSYANLTTADRQIIQVTDAGSVTFGSDLRMASGQLTVANQGIIMFNGSTSRSFDFGGGNTPVFTAASGSTVYFRKGLRTGTTTATFDPASTVVFIGTGTITPTSAITFGNVEIANSTTITAGGILTIKGDWSNDGTYISGSNAVIFNGASEEFINGSGTIFNKVDINNSSGVTLNSPVTITVLTLISGLINSDDANLLTINNGGSISPAGGASDKYINGPVKKIGNTAFVFPVGKGGKWRRIGMTAPANATDAFTAEYFNTPYTNTGNSSPITDISTVEYWTLDQSAGTSNVRLTLYWEDASQSGINNCPDLTIAHWNGSAWVEEAATAVGSCTLTGAGSVQTNTVVTSFSPFTFGSKSIAVNPLPIELLEFTAKEQDNKVFLKWTTASEINNDYFTIEKSQDGITFEEVIKVKGYGNSISFKEYSAIDYNPYSAISYYRLKQTDFDGKYEYSQLVAVNFNENKNSLIFNIYPTPNENSFTLDLLNNKNITEEVLIGLYEINGKEIYSKHITIEKGNKTSMAINTANSLPAGVYFVTAYCDQSLYRQKFIVR